MPVIDSLETIDHLLDYADPAGDVFPRLQTLRKKVEQRAMLGPGSIKWLTQLIDIVEKSNYECGLLIQTKERCRMKGTRCEHLERFVECPHYQSPPMKGKRR
jgi:hypothetical protein